MVTWIHWWKIINQIPPVHPPIFQLKGVVLCSHSSETDCGAKIFQLDHFVCSSCLFLIWIQRKIWSKKLRMWSRCLRSFSLVLRGSKKNWKKWVKYTLSHPHHPKKTTLKTSKIIGKSVNPSCYLKHSWTRTQTTLTLRFPPWMLWTWLQFQRFRSRPRCQFLRRFESPPPAYPSLENPSHGQQLWKSTSAVAEGNKIQPDLKWLMRKNCPEKMLTYWIVYACYLFFEFSTNLFGFFF